MKRYVITSLCAGLWMLPGMAQEADTAEGFFQEGWAKTEGILPVYRKDGQVCLELPRNVWGRELLVTAQIDRGFDLIGRPAESLGVVRVRVEDDTEVLLEQPLYAERLLSGGTELEAAFQASNHQRQGKTCPVKAVSPDGGLVIDMTEALATGNDWFHYAYQEIRSLDPDHARVTGVRTLADGVSFSISRRHGYAPDRAIVSGAAMVLPEGSMPLELSCTVRLLPETDMPLRLAGEGLPFRTLTFQDYTQDPYRMVTDSLILRWRMSRPVTVGIDPYFPKEYLPAVRRSADTWNSILRQAGIRQGWEVHELAVGERADGCDVLVAYDLGAKGVRVSSVHHPRTGEILWGRINVGHGFLPERLDAYWWQEGATDARIRKDRRSAEVAAGLVEGEMNRAFGQLLGLQSMLPQEGFLRESGEISPTDRRAVVAAYKRFPGCKDSYADRRAWQKWMQSATGQDSKAAESPLRRYVDKLDGLRHQFAELDAQAAGAEALYTEGLRWYGFYLKGVADIVGSDAPGAVQQEAMQVLGERLFRGSDAYDNRAVVRNSRVDRHRYVRDGAEEVFARLLSPATVGRLERAGWYATGAETYTADAFFNDLYTSLFQGFRTEASFTGGQLDAMLLCMETWAKTLKDRTDAGDRAGQARLFAEHAYVRKQLERLARGHKEPQVRHLCALMSGL